MKDRYEYIKHAALIKGSKRTFTVNAPVSTASRTVIAPTIAKATSIGKATGPTECTRSALGTFCGKTLTLNIALPGTGCDPNGAAVRAIVADTTAIAPAIIGYDVLSKLQPVLRFPWQHMTVTCKRGATK